MDNAPVSLFSKRELRTILSQRAARLKLDVASSVAQLALVSLRLYRSRAA